MTTQEAMELQRMATVQKGGKPGTVVGVGNHGFFVIWEGEKKAEYIKNEEATGIHIK